jgi:hypothetical protein
MLLRSPHLSVLQRSPLTKKKSKKAQRETIKTAAAAILRSLNDSLILSDTKEIKNEGDLGERVETYIVSGARE